MHIIDISWPISSAITGYKDKSVVNFEEIKNFYRDGARETNITVSAHTGTHIDAPSHFLKEGKTIDHITLDRYVGDCIVLDMTQCAERVTRNCLSEYAEHIQRDSIVLLRTTNSDLTPTDKFNPHFIYLEESGARYLVEKNVKAVGIDYLGIERGQPGHPTHETLMNNDVSIIEGLRLAHVQAGNYFFVGLPLHVVGIEAAPARVILIKK